MKLLFLMIFFLILLPSIAHAGDEASINDQLKNSNNVHLPSGIYNIEGPIYIPNDGTTFSGESDTILRVSCPNGRWFSNSIGIINSHANNLEIFGFQVDGNIRSMPSSYSDSSSATSHDCGKLIILGGSSGQHAQNISVHDMTLYDAFSDSMYIRYTDGVSCYNNVISDCQHSSIFWAGVTNGQMYNNKIAGICSDAARLDNCIDCKISGNLFFSFDGNSFGAYKHGENLLQIADGGSSHGYTTNNPMKTNNIEVCDNIFSDPGLRAIWYHGGENVYIHDNTFVNADELKTMGVSVDIGNISYANQPTIEQSEQVFGSIFDIFNKNYYSQAGENDTIILPEGMKGSPSEAAGTIEYQIIGNTTNTLVNLPINGLSEVQYEINGTKATHTLMIGEKTSKGIHFYTTSIWGGELNHTGDSLKLNGRVPQSRIKVKCITPKGEFTPTLKTKESEIQTIHIHPGIPVLIFVFIILGRFIRKLLKNSFFR